MVIIEQGTAIIGEHKEHSLGRWQMKRYDEEKKERSYMEWSLNNIGDSGLKHAFSVKVKITMGVKSGLGEAEKWVNITELWTL